jgi:hypothetical protein
MYFPYTFVPSPGTTPQSLTTFWMSTFCVLLCSYLSRIRRALDAMGQVCMTLQHPLPSCGYPFMGGLVLGGLVL